MTSHKKPSEIDTKSTQELAAANPYALVGERLAGQHEWYRHCVPLTMQVMRELTKQLLATMFPHFSETSCRFELADALQALEDRLVPIIACTLNNNSSAIKSGHDAQTIARRFLSGLPEIADLARDDAAALLEGDPAAKSLDEVILSYPGFYAVAVYRLAHRLWEAGVPIMPRMMTEAAHQRTGIDIHPAATIGRRFYIDHGTGVVIGETTVIGDNVKLYQGVTLGGLKVEKDAQDQKRHPTLEDNVTVYAGATILGGDTVVGHDCVVGGNVWLTRSVAPWSRVMFRSCDSEEIIPLKARIKA